MTAKSILLAAAAALTFVAPAFAAITDIRIDDNNVYPESIGSANGVIYIGSSNKGIIYRAKPGEAFAEPWIAPQGTYTRVNGVLGDAATQTLYICYNSPRGGKSQLRTYQLPGGKPKGVYDMPGGGVCNDISPHNGDTYITDTQHGRVLKLAKGATALAEWYTQPSDAPQADRSFDGIAWTRDGKLYVTAYGGGHLIRIDANPDGSAGKGAVLTTDKQLFQPDGLRLSTSGKVLLVEGQNHPDNTNMKMGRVSEVDISGDNATIKILKDGFEVPSGVTPIGDTIWVNEDKTDYQRRADHKGMDPGEFHLHAMPFR